MRGGQRMYDFVILGGGSSGCTLAARLSEDARNRVLLVEAGKDVTAETAPADVLASYPGRAYFNPDFTWPGLERAARRREPERSGEPPARALRAGAHPRRRLEHQRAVRQPRRADRLRQLGAARRDGLELRVGAAVFPQARARSRLRRRLSRQGRPDHHPPLSGRGLGRLRRHGRQGAGEARPAARAGPERQVGRRRDAGRGLDRRARPARLLRDGLPDAAVRARQNLDIRTETYVRRILFEGTRADRRRDRARRRERGRARPRIDPHLRVDPQSGGADAQRRRRAGRARQARHRGRGRAAGRRAQPDRAPLGQHLVLSRPRRRGSRTSSGITPRRMCGFPRACPAVRPAT